MDHTYTDLIRQRVLQIACGYEDANDSNDLRSDPGMKTACDRLPITGDDLASQPTISRLENQVSRTDLYRVGRAFLDTFIDSYDKPPKKIILDIDDTDDPTHGSQQLCLFNAHIDELLLYACAYLRRGDRQAGHERFAIGQKNQRKRGCCEPQTRDRTDPTGVAENSDLLAWRFTLQRPTDT